MAVKKVDNVEEEVEVTTKATKEVEVTKVEELPDNLFVSKNGTRLLFNKGAVPPNIVQEITTKAFMEANLGQDGRPNSGTSTNEQIVTAHVFLTFMKDILRWGIFSLYDGLPTNQRWIKNLRGTESFESSLKLIDWNDPLDVEVAYIMFFAVTVDDLDKVIEFVND